jgi:hypothetical protein
LALAILQPYDRPPQRWVQSDSGQWFQVTDIASWLCLPAGSSDDNGPASGVEPFCGLCIVGNSLQASVPEAAILSLTTQCAHDTGHSEIAFTPDHRIGDRPPARAPPFSYRLT